MRRALLAIGAGLLLGCAKGAEPATSGDVRAELRLTPEQQDAVLAEMRTMLGSLDGVLGGLVAYDTAAMQRAALASGLAAAVDPALEKVLPEPFLQLGTGTHRQFDSLAAAVSAGAPRDSIVARLGRLTGSCVGCHASYRLSRRQAAR